MAKENEGDPRRRGRLARDAREKGLAPSAEGVTLGSSKQIEHERGGRRSGPSERAGNRKLTAAKPVPPSPAWPPRPVPHWDPAAVGADVNPGELSYRDVIYEVGRRIGRDFERAKAATTATVTAVARMLPGPERVRLLQAMPPGLYGDEAVDPLDGEAGLNRFVAEAGRLAGDPPEQALLHAQAVLRVLDERDGGLVRSLHLPDDVRDLFAEPPTGGGLTGPEGQTPPLTTGELQAEMASLPYWAVEGRALCRTIELPRENLDRVLDLIAGIQRELGRAPHIGRVDENTATLALRTLSVNAVTRLDVELAHRIDDAIDAAGAGIAGPRGKPEAGPRRV